MIEIPVNLGPRSYPILVGAGALKLASTHRYDLEEDHATSPADDG